MGIFFRIDSMLPNQATDTASGFDEPAIFILVYKNENWWLAAARHVPDKRDVYQS